MSIAEQLEDKKILIWGYGREGKSTERFIQQFCRVKSLEIFEGLQEDIKEEQYDYIIKSPGIKTERYGANYTSQTELFLSEFAGQTIGITGTKGKSTTSALLYHALSAGTSRKVLLVGNLGFPCLDYYKEIDQDTIIVFEMSCHQLAHISVSPHIAVFLNLYEEHLDYYGTFEKYAAAKMNITLHQKEEDYFFYGDHVPEINTKAKKTHLVYDPEMKFEMKLLGAHNQFNAQVVYRISRDLFSCPEDAVRGALKEFGGLSHRLEHFACISGVDYYDDSISTIPEASIQALKSIPNSKTILIGGMDRNIDYDILIDFIRNNDQYYYILSYESGARIYQQVSDLEYCFYKDDLEGAAALAKKITPAGTACVLSPAAASYGYFTNFEERGRVFQELVKSVSIAFTGDIGFDKYMAGKWEDEELISDEVLSFLNSADHVAANIEGPVTGAEKKPRENSVLSMMHSIDPAAAKVFRKMNADIWNINNNHIMDAGPDGLKDTLLEAGRFGAKAIGAGMNIREAAQPLFLEGAGGIGLLSVGYQRACRPAGEDKAGCLSWSAMDIIESKIKEIKEACRWCIIVSHGGEEFTSLPNPYTRDRYLKYLEMGADIVVCHHPHVPMNYETFPEKAIFYSLGNFIFDTDYQRAQFNTEKGVVVKLRFTEEAFSFEPMGIRIDRENEKIIKGELPDIFCDVQEDEYRKLAPLAAKMFIAATKRQLTFLKPEEFANASEEKWQANFSEPLRSGRVPGEALDFAVICPLAEEESKKEWKESKLDSVVRYILQQM